MEQRTTNSVEEMRGQPLAARVQARRTELERALEDLGPEETLVRREIEQALATADSLSTGDLSHPPEPVAAQLSQWLERNKNLGLVSETAEPESSKTAEPQRSKVVEPESSKAAEPTSSKRTEPADREP